MAEGSLLLLREIDKMSTRGFFTGAGDRNLRSAHKSIGQEGTQYMEDAFRGPMGNSNCNCEMTEI